ncbi:MAG: chromate transporter [Porticoccaceae bacterium]|nr:chromate transporter [Porticoccaceae bacterium]
MSVYWELFLAFFIPNIVGYGGGPAIIPLIEAEVVGNYGWMSVQEFSEVLALGNALPSPIATKMAGYIGFEVAGVPGAIVAVFATVAPSLLLMITLLGLLYRHRDNIKVKTMSMLVRPTIAVMMGVLAWNFLDTSYQNAGWLHTAVLVVAAVLLLEKVKLHPAIVICGGLGYGALFLGAG